MADEKDKVNEMSAFFYWQCLKKESTEHFSCAHADNTKEKIVQPQLLIKFA